MNICILKYMISSTKTQNSVVDWFVGFDMFSENNDLKCIIRSHTEIRSGCTIAHEGCYTVFSAPNKEKGILGGVLVVDVVDDIRIQGHVFTDCDKEEALCLMGDPTFSSLLPLTQSLKELDIEKVKGGEKPTKWNKLVSQL